MSSVSENVFDIYSSTFYQCVVVIGLIVVTINMIWEIGTGSFNYRNAVIDVWALITCITYIVGRNNRHKYVIMWAVLFSQLMLALWTIRYYIESTVNIHSAFNSFKGQDIFHVRAAALPKHTPDFLFQIPLSVPSDSVPESLLRDPVLVMEH